MSIIQRSAHVEEGGEILRRLARRAGQTPSQIVRDSGISRWTPEGHDRGEGPRPKTPAGTSTIAATITAWLKTQTHNGNSAPALTSLSGQSGQTPTNEISPFHIGNAITSWKGKSQHTRKNYTNALRRFLNWTAQQGLTSYALLSTLPRIHQPSPRLIVASQEERRKLLDTAAPNLRFFLLLCADLGLRHKTAAGLRPCDYNRGQRTITFRTKNAATQTLPVSGEIAATIEGLPEGSKQGRPIVALLQTTPRGSITGTNPRFQKQFDRLKEKCEIRKELHIHDLRRTAAEEVWDATHDLRAAQAQLGHSSPATTARYLANRVTQDDLRGVREAIEQMRSRRKE